MTKRVMKYGDGYPRDYCWPESVPDDYQPVGHEYFIIGETEQEKGLRQRASQRRVAFFIELIFFPALGALAIASAVAGLLNHN